MTIRGIGQPDDSPISKSAMLISTACAVVSKDPVYAEMFRDPFAERFATAISAEAGPVLATLDDAKARATFIAEWEEGMDGLITHVVYRKPWIEGAVRDALADGMRQLVIFGAGCDTLSLRLADELADLPVFEVDQQDVITFRDRVLADGDGVPTGVCRVGIDFRRQTVCEGLYGAGYHRTLPTIFVAEGVMEYLTPHEVESIFALVRDHAPIGSRFAFTFLARSVYADESFDSLRAELDRGGETLQFGLMPEQLDDFLAAYGMRRLAFDTPESLDEKMRRNLNVPVGVIPGFHFVAVETVSA
ncbi:MAG: SAM-dependent methyltransferase [Alphaproteobacteria bacterium]|jgi:methyltransferase (TIGR00027 family)|nr:SAM-dependent methyltransferase [Alphaproteobacteria bacterium]MDP6237820.1 SAM-dependent methyltransferase [Alphaproteobacteria bacterium]MDP7173477.1 SAM-dependent methyltransferase [Alphaproteobacteria bacterium]MDP7233442.1 SAM-dependent methyltransferase [Alphaproteobacteria bacterium]MDP7486974.1 SAM-dependent methyltransferase [Alphaproteobacteria bacterium]|tara:strand:- start:4523 stop:5431 length:909 start_codon:yes stop_codon:yes gene_type:complete